jgi:16S rRNA (cytosine967-C5)-methyltransferase
VLTEALVLPVEGPNQVPEYSKKVIVEKFTAESVMVGANVYVPGVISFKKVKRGDQVSIVDPEGLIVGAGIAEIDDAELHFRAKGLAVKATHTIYRVPSLRELEEFREGLIYPQSLPSMVTVRVLDPKPKETIIDLTCAPGGKLSHICQLTENKAVVYGFDRSSKKILETGETLRRLGCQAKLISADSRYLNVDFPEIKADRILVDPPCSALGVTPKLYDWKKREEIFSLANYQKQFLKAASKMVKSGGIIVYSVCTMTVEECEEVARFAVEECGLKPDSQPLTLGSEGLPGFKGSEFFQRFHPDLHGYGYFIARFRKP